MTTPGGICRTPTCDTPVADAFVCSTCAHRLTVALADAPELLEELLVDVTRQSRSGTRVGGRTAEKPLPYDVGASLARDVLVSTLRTWCLVLAGDLLGQAPPDEDLPGHLADRIEAIRHHVEGGTLVDEISAAVSAAREHLHRSDRDPSMLAGHCPDCGHTLYARQTAAVARCRVDGCDGTVDVATGRQKAIQSLPDRALPMGHLVRALHVLGCDVPEGTVKSWIHRERLTPAGTRGGRPVYLVADAVTLAEQRK